ncbi:hypothetical protein [Rhodoblastus sp.]|uniref:hypothetical protein n=1 Tax=Rhodoblastus sp. TaxID=1962975 RepID=UPI003F9D00DB
MATLSTTLKAAEENLAEIDLAPTRENPCALIADKGYHSRDGFKDLADGVWKTRIAEPKPAKGYLRWRGDEAARDAVYANRAWLKSGVGRAAMRRRGELVERSFAHVLDRGGMRRVCLRSPSARWMDINVRAELKYLSWRPDIAGRFAVIVNIVGPADHEPVRAV